MEHTSRYIAFLRSRGLPVTTNKKDYTNYVKFIRKQKSVFLDLIGKTQLESEKDHKKFTKYLIEKFPSGSKPLGQLPLEFPGKNQLMTEPAVEGFF